MKRLQVGLTLIELLVAIVISIVAVDAAISLLLANRNAANTTSGLANVTDNGRVALTFISESVRSGGYMACNATNDMRELLPAGDTRQINIMAAGASPMKHNYVYAFGGYEANGTGPGSAVAVAAAPVNDGTASDWANVGGLDASLVGKVVKNTDVLVVRETIPQVTPIFTTTAYQTGTGQVQLQVNNVGTMTPGSFAVISDCTISSAFVVGAVGALTVNTNAGSDLFGGDLKWSYGNPATVMPVDMYVYYLGVGRDGDSSLYRYDEAAGTSQELAPDIENMQILYGEAPNSPNQATVYVTADQVTNFNAIVAIKVAVLAASPPSVAAANVPTVAQPFAALYDTLTPPLDGRLRKVFDTTVTVRNAAL